MTLDIENGVADVGSINDPNWPKQIAQMRLLARMVKAQRIPVAFYMNWHYDFQNPYNIQRHLFDQQDLKRALPFVEKQERFYQRSQVVAAEFRDMVDVVTYKGYPAYRIDAVDGAEMRRYLAVLKHNAKMMRMLYPAQTATDLATAQLHSR